MLKNKLSLPRAISCVKKEEQCSCLTVEYGEHTKWQCCLSAEYMSKDTISPYIYPCPWTKSAKCHVGKEKDDVIGQNLPPKQFIRYQSRLDHCPAAVFGAVCPSGVGTAFFFILKIEIQGNEKSHRKALCIFLAAAPTWGSLRSMSTTSCKMNYRKRERGIVEKGLTDGFYLLKGTQIMAFWPWTGEDVFQSTVKMNKRNKLLAIFPRSSRSKYSQIHLQLGKDTCQGL